MTGGRCAAPLVRGVVVGPWTTLAPSAVTHGAPSGPTIMSRGSDPSPVARGWPCRCVGPDAPSTSEVPAPLIGEPDAAVGCRRHVVRPGLAGAGTRSATAAPRRPIRAAGLPGGVLPAGPVVGAATGSAGRGVTTAAGQDDRGGQRDDQPAGATPTGPRRRRAGRRTARTPAF
jgi:hypothetical protein